MTAKTPAERQYTKRQRKKAKGLRPVEVWVPADKIIVMKSLEKRYQDLTLETDWIKVEVWVPVDGVEEVEALEKRLNK